LNGPGALEALRERLEEEGDPITPVEPVPALDGGLGALAAAGPRCSRDPDGYAFVVEAVREGYLCHFGRPRLLTPVDADLSLLAGDLLYAIGISRLAAIDDVESTGLLSDLIRLSADLHAAGAESSAEALWAAQILALSCGSDRSLPPLLAALPDGGDEARTALEDWSGRTAESHGMGRALSEARQAIHFRPTTP
jgi:hypothetical protein